MEELNTPKEIKFSTGDMIVSSTDTKGTITYVNDIFCKLAGYSREELIGQPHNIIRHEDMPKVVFKLLWQEVMKGNTIYAFVKNKAKNGDYYWVKAYVKPIYKNGEIVQLTSYRKPVNDFAKEYVTNLYKTLVEFEKTNSVDESLALVLDYLNERGITYNQFIDRLSLGKGVDIINKMNSFEYLNQHIIFKAHYMTEVRNGNTDIEVVDCQSCAFGKRVLELEAAGEDMTKTPEWEDMKKHHSHVHADVARYVELSKQGASQEERERALSQVNQDTQNIFGNLNKLIDTYKG
jgi:PAS domain S-box-containing protein